MGCNCRKRRRGGTWIVIDPATNDCLMETGGRCIEYQSPELATAAGNAAKLTSWAIREQK
jgi:hypothetical protein